MAAGEHTLTMLTRPLPSRTGASGPMASTRRPVHPIEGLPVARPGPEMPRRSRPGVLWRYFRSILAFSRLPGPPQQLPWRSTPMTFRSPRAFLAVFLLSALVLAGPASAKPKKQESSPAKAAEPDKPYGDWKKVTSGAQLKRGFFNLYAKRENLYLELQPSQLGTEFLGVWQIARGIGRDFLLGGLSIFDDRLLTFERSGDHVLLIEKNTRFTVPKVSAIEKATDLPLGNSVLASLKIESINDETHSLLVDFAPLV